MNALRGILGCFVLLLAGIACAQEQLLRDIEERDFPKGATRLALIVWSEQYKYLDPVENAGSDGRRIARQFNEMKFDFVRELPDADSADAILKAVDELKAQITASSRPVVIVFYFAGHGFQIEGENYLVPTSAPNTSTSELVGESVSVNAISGLLNPNRRASMLFFMLDACRTIRFMEDGSLKDVAVREGITPGFQDGTMPASALVSMAAAPGQAARSVSSREDRKNSPYTLAIAPFLNTTGLSLQALLTDSQSRVLQDTDGLQKPTWFNGSSGNTFFFRPGDAQLQEDRRAWQVVLKHGGNLKGCVQDYLLRYPTGQYAMQAEYMFSRAAKSDVNCSVKPKEHP